MIDLATMRNHLRVIHTVEDDLIQLYLDAAQDHIADYLGVSELPDERPIDAAVMLLATDLFAERGRQGSYVFNANPTYQLLLAPYRDLSVQ